jgi:hypothetical protein
MCFSNLGVGCLFRLAVILYGGRLPKGESNPKMCHTRNCYQKVSSDNVTAFFGMHCIMTAGRDLIFGNSAMSIVDRLVIFRDGVHAVLVVHRCSCV